MMHKRIILSASFVALASVGLGSMSLPPSDAPPAFREYCAGRCHLSPTSVLSGKKAAFQRWARLSRVDRGLKLCTMGLNLYDRSYDHYDPSRKGIPLEDHQEIMAYLDHYFNLPVMPGADVLHQAYAADD
ncbi:MAG: hypothetical protein PVF51_14220 [Nitrospirota bacterium]|jgi:hypothetical protein